MVTYAAAAGAVNEVGAAVGLEATATIKTTTIVAVAMTISYE